MRVFAYLLMRLAFVLMWVHFVMLLFRDLDQRDLLGGGLMPHPTVWYVLAGIVAAGFLLLGARIVLSSGYDPNRSGNVRKLKEEGAARAIDLAKLRRKLETEELKRRIKSQVPKG